MARLKDLSPHVRRIVERVLLQKDEPQPSLQEEIVQALAKRRANKATKIIVSPSLAQTAQDGPEEDEAAAAAWMQKQLRRQHKRQSNSKPVNGRLAPHIPNIGATGRD